MEMNLDMCKCHAHTRVIMELSEHLKPEILLTKMVKSHPVLAEGSQFSDSRDKNWS